MSGRGRAAESDVAVIRLKPLHYVHVLSLNDNVARVEVGPQTFTRKEHERIILGPEPMVTVPPRHCVIVTNPVVRDAQGNLVLDKYGGARLRYGDQEIRFSQEPFPLYPGEEMQGKITPLQVVQANQALRLVALRDVVMEESTGGKDAKVTKVQRHAGDEWLFRGPGTYLPRVEVQVAERVDALVVKTNQALKLRARREFVDRHGVKRAAGEEWLHRESGAFLPEVYEEVAQTVEARILTDKKALHLRALKTFVDVFKVSRKAGEEWLVTIDMCEAHLPDVHEEVVGEVRVTTLSNRQYCVVLDPVDPKVRKPRLGHRELRVGETSFFLQPGEKLESGIQSVYVLGEGEALLLRAREGFTDTSAGSGDKAVTRRPGDRWMVNGPCDYVPPVTVEVVEKRPLIALGEKEGIYVRDINTGQVRSVIGKSYMLLPNEELWQKDLPAEVEELLGREPLSDRSKPAPGVGKAAVQTAQGSKRDRARVVSYRVPHNAAVQIYDFKAKKARVIFGPELVLLGPDESFTVLSLSGGKPKRPHVLKTLALLLGPDFMTDIIVVETSDHARLSLQVSYNWEFQVAKDAPARLFSVPDFVGDACKAIASRIRGAVAAVPFDQFHRASARLIRVAVFGQTSDGKVRDDLVFPANGLRITNIDVQSVEPVDARTRDSLMKSVQLAIEITTKSQEAAARHEAERVEQKARGELERQKIHDMAEAERARSELLMLQAKSNAVESTGQARAEAEARAEAAEIEGTAMVKQAELKAKAVRIQVETEMQGKKLAQEAELSHKQAMFELEVKRARELAEIEAGKFKATVEAVGQQTLVEMARAGPAAQAEMLKGLGLNGFLITDGNSPINLLNTAHGLVNSTSSSIVPRPGE